MHVRCYLRQARGKRSLAEITAATGISRGQLSEIERGVRLPTWEQMRAIEQGYGVGITACYSPLALLAIQEDESG